MYTNKVHRTVIFSPKYKEKMRLTEGLLSLPCTLKMFSKSPIDSGTY